MTWVEIDNRMAPQNPDGTPHRCKASGPARLAAWRGGNARTLGTTYRDNLALDADFRRAMDDGDE